MLRIGWLLFAFTLCTLASQAETFALTLTGYEVNDVGYAPVRAMADWLGAKCVYAEATRQITLSDLTTSVILTTGSREAKVNDLTITLPAAVASYDGVAYAPVRALVEAYGSLTAWDADTWKLIVLNKKRLAPLEITLAPTTPRERRDAETLAGLTIGDHPLKAFALWGRPMDSRASKVLPGARDFYFQIDADYGISLLVIVKNNTIALVQTLITGYKSASALGAYLSVAGTKGGVQLTKPVPEKYLTHKTPVEEYSITSNEYVVESYAVGDLLVAALRTTYEKTQGITEITLVKRGFPRESLPVSGPVPVLFTDDQPITVEPVVTPLPVVAPLPVAPIDPIEIKP